MHRHLSYHQLEGTSALAPVTEFLAQNSDLQGCKALALLMRKPGEPVWCKDLIMAINPVESPYTPEQVAHLTQSREVIPMTDKATLKQVRKELMKLYQLKAELQTADQPTTRLDHDIAACEKYIKDTTTPYGIKSFITDDKAAYDSLSAALRRLVRKAEKECPEAACEIQKHLQTGRYCSWRL
jgi:hypothetical protein